MKNSYPSFSLLIFLLLFLSFTDQLSAQKSFYKRGRATISDVHIITMEGVNPHYSFAVVNKGKTTHWGPTEVDAYRKHYGNLYISREIEPGHFAFLELIVEGTLNLYYLKDQNLESRFYLERKDGVFIEMTNENRKPSYYMKVLEKEWVNCPQLDRYIKESTYSKASMARIVKSHNTCKRLLNPAIRHSVYGGVGYTAYNVANSRNVVSAVPIGGLRRGDYPRKPSYYLGYNLEIPVLSTNTSLITGVRLHKIDVDYFNLLGFGEVTFTIDASTLDLGIKAGLMHNFLLRNLKGFLSFELIPSYQIIDDVLVTFNVLEPDGQIKTTTSDFSTAKFALASNLGVGVKVPINDRHELGLRIGYDVRLGTGNTRLFNVTSPIIMVYYSL